MSKYYKVDDVISKIVNTPTRVITDDLTALADRQHEIIDMLADLPTIEVDEDCISREWVKGICESMLDEEMLGHMLGYIEDAPSVVSKAQTETQNSNKNSNVISVYDGVSEAVRCAMCSNPNKSDRGCDGACSYDEKLYKRIMDAINASSIEVSEDAVSREQLKSLSYINKGNFNSVEGIRDWIDAAPSVIPKPKEGEWKWETNDICHNCGYEIPHLERIVGETVLMDSKDWQYCPNCGAKMKV